MIKVQLALAHHLATLTSGWGNDLERPELCAPFWEGIRGKYDPYELPGAMLPSHIIYICLTADTSVESWFLDDLAVALRKHLPAARAFDEATIVKDLRAMCKWLSQPVREITRPK